MIHVQNEEEAEHALHALCLFSLDSEHVDEVLDQSELRLAWPQVLGLAPTQKEESGHQLGHPSDEVHRVSACIPCRIGSTQSHDTDGQPVHRVATPGSQRLEHSQGSSGNLLGPMGELSPEGLGLLGVG